MKIKYDYLVVKDNNSLNSDLFKPSIFYVDSVQVLMISLNRMLVRSESTSKLPIWKLLYCSVISFAHEKESLTVNSLIVGKLGMGT